MIGNAVGGLATGLYIKRVGKYTSPCYLAMVAILISNVLMIWRWGMEESFMPSLEGLYVFGAGMGTGISHAAAFVVLTAGITAYGKEKGHGKDEIQDDIAITGSGMYLSGNIGATIGVSLSAALLQALMKGQLAVSLQGDELQQVTRHALESIEWVQNLERGSKLRDIVVGAYISGIHGTFWLGAGSAIIGLILCPFIVDCDLF